MHEYEQDDRTPTDYEPEVDDYVIWERETWVGTIKDEGWVYFKGDPEVAKKGFKTNPRYITIETGVRDKSPEQMDGCTLHNKVHTLLLCYESNWHQLKFVKKRESRNIQHWSQYDDITGNEGN
tara:strand:- start:1095 stop:1463 length:369 start_codon:yes stop_codon:yes gene_type:complete